MSSPRSLCCLATLLGLLLVLMAPAPARGQCEGRWLQGSSFPDVDGTVSAVVAWDPDGLGPQVAVTVIGGDFSYADGTAASRIAAWDGTSWKALGAGMNAPVLALAVWNGSLIAGGEFTSAGGTAVDYIARWDGSVWQPLGDGPNRVVRSLAVYQGDLAVGGDFTVVQGAIANRVARWNGSSWSAVGQGLVGSPGSVYALTVQGESLIAGGSFLASGLTPMSRVARWNGSAWEAMALGANVTVRALAVYNDQIIAAGLFTMSGSTPANHIMRWTGSAWTGLDVGANNHVYSLYVDGATLYAGGHFTAIGGAQAIAVAKWNGTGWSTTSWNLVTKADPWVYALGVVNGTLFAGGDFLATGTKPARGIARLVSSSWGRVSPGRYADISVLAAHAERVVVSGSFTSIDGVAANNIAEWDGVAWRPLGSGLSGRAWALASYDGKLIAGGSFTGAGGGQSKRLAQWDGQTWSPVGGGISTGSSIETLLVFDGELIAGGAFTAIGPGVSASRIAAWNGASWRPLGAGRPATVTNLAVYRGKLVAAGTSGGLSAWDGSAWADIPGAEPTISGMIEHQDLLYTAGSFSLHGSQEHYVRAGDGALWGSAGLRPVLFAPGGRATSIVSSNGLPVVGGTFTHIVPLDFPYLARKEAEWSPLGVGISQPVEDLAVHNGELIAVSDYFARWADTPAPWIAVQPAASTAVSAGASLTLSATPASGYDFAGPLAVQWRRGGQLIADGPGGASAGGGIVAGAAGSISTLPSGAPQAAVLTISNIQPSDAGSYDCLISNGCGTATSTAAVITVTGGGCPADLNADGVIDFADYLEFLNFYDALDLRVDFNQDGVVDFGDYLEFLNHYDAGC